MLVLLLLLLLVQVVAIIICIIISLEKAQALSALSPIKLLSPSYSPYDDLPFFHFQVVLVSFLPFHLIHLHDAQVTKA